MNTDLLKILIVDDSQLVPPRIKSLLESMKQEIVIGVSVNAEEAIGIMEEVVPDVILLDLNLPGKSGVELLKDIKSGYPRIIVIVFTNHTEPYYRAICKEFGADYFFDKSTEFEMVPATLETLMTAECETY